MEGATTLWKSGSQIGRFNSNNTLTREADNRGSSFGTMLYTSPGNAKLPWDMGMTGEYSVDLDMEKVALWEGYMDNEQFFNMLFESGVTRSVVESNKFSLTQNRLVIMEEAFVSRMFAEVALKETGLSKSFDTVEEFDQYVDGMRCRGYRFQQPL